MDDLIDKIKTHLLMYNEFYLMGSGVLSLIIVIVILYFSY